MKIDLSDLMTFLHIQQFPTSIKGVKIKTIDNSVNVGTADLVLNSEHDLVLTLKFSEGCKISANTNVKLETKKSLGAKQQWPTSSVR